jgi:hypothetical protein
MQPTILVDENDTGTVTGPAGILADQTYADLLDRLQKNNLQRFRPS